MEKGSTLPSTAIPETADKTHNKLNYHCVGWYDNEQCEGEVVDFDTYHITEDTTFYGKYVSDVTYTVTYTDGVVNEEVFKDQTYPNLALNSQTPEFEGTPRREGYTFTGWQPTVAEKVTADITYVAQWREKDNVTINYVSADTKMGTVAPATGVATGSTATAKAGYEFVNWTDAAGKEVSKAVKFVPAKVNGLNVAATYTAHFTKASFSYTVNYYFDDTLDADMTKAGEGVFEESILTAAGITEIPATMTHNRANYVLEEVVGEDNTITANADENVVRV